MGQPLPRGGGQHLCHQGSPQGGDLSITWMACEDETMLFQKRVWKTRFKPSLCKSRVSLIVSDPVPKATAAGRR